MNDKSHGVWLPPAGFHVHMDIAEVQTAKG